MLVYWNFLFFTESLPCNRYLLLLGRVVLRGITLLAIRTNPYMQAFYDRLKDNGKHSTLAQIAVMRKMILIAHSLYKNNQKFDNELYEKRISGTRQTMRMSLDLSCF